MSNPYAICDYNTLCRLIRLLPMDHTHYPHLQKITTAVKHANKEIEEEIVASGGTKSSGVMKLKRTPYSLVMEHPTEDSPEEEETSGFYMRIVHADGAEIDFSSFTHYEYILRIHFKDHTPLHFVRSRTDTSDSYINTILYTSSNGNQLKLLVHTEASGLPEELTRSYATCTFSKNNDPVMYPRDIELEEDSGFYEIDSEGTLAIPMEEFMDMTFAASNAASVITQDIMQEKFSQLGDTSLRDLVKNLYVFFRRDSKFEYTIEPIEYNSSPNMKLITTKGSGRYSMKGILDGEYFIEYGGVNNLFVHAGYNYDTTGCRVDYFVNTDGKFIRFIDYYNDNKKRIMDTSDVIIYDESLQNTIYLHTIYNTTSANPSYDIRVSTRDYVKMINYGVDLIEKMNRENNIGYISLSREEYTLEIYPELDQGEEYRALKVIKADGTLGTVHDIMQSCGKTFCLQIDTSEPKYFSVVMMQESNGFYYAYLLDQDMDMLVMNFMNYDSLSEDTRNELPEKEIVESVITLMYNKSENGEMSESIPITSIGALTGFYVLDRKGTFKIPLDIYSRLQKCTIDYFNLSVGMFVNELYQLYGNIAESLPEYKYRTYKTITIEDYPEETTSSYRKKTILNFSEQIDLSTCANSNYILRIDSTNYNSIIGVGYKYEKGISYWAPKYTQYPNLYKIEEVEMDGVKKYILSYTDDMNYLFPIAENVSTAGIYTRTEYGYSMELTMQEYDSYVAPLTGLILEDFKKSGCGKSPLQNTEIPADFTLAIADADTSAGNYVWNNPEGLILQTPANFIPGSIVQVEDSKGILTTFIYAWYIDSDTTKSRTIYCLNTSEDELLRFDTNGYKGSVITHIETFNYIVEAFDIKTIRFAFSYELELNDKLDDSSEMFNLYRMVLARNIRYNNERFNKIELDPTVMNNTGNREGNVETRIILSGDDMNVEFDESHHKYTFRKSSAQSLCGFQGYINITAGINNYTGICSKVSDKGEFKIYTYITNNHNKPYIKFTEDLTQNILTFRVSDIFENITDITFGSVHVPANTLQSVIQGYGESIEETNQKIEDAQTDLFDIIPDESAKEYVMEFTHSDVRLENGVVSIPCVENIPYDCILKGTIIKLYKNSKFVEGYVWNYETSDVKVFKNYRNNKLLRCYKSTNNNFKLGDFNDLWEDFCVHYDSIRVILRMNRYEINYIKDMSIFDHGYCRLYFDNTMNIPVDTPVGTIMHLCKDGTIIKTYTCTTASSTSHPTFTDVSDGTEKSVKIEYSTIYNKYYIIFGDTANLDEFVPLYDSFIFILPGTSEKVYPERPVINYIDEATHSAINQFDYTPDDISRIVEINWTDEGISFNQGYTTVNTDKASIIQEKLRPLTILKLYRKGVLRDVYRLVSLESESTFKGTKGGKITMHSDAISSTLRFCVYVDYNGSRPDDALIMSSDKMIFIFPTEDEHNRIPERPVLNYIADVENQISNFGNTLISKIEPDIATITGGAYTTEIQLTDSNVSLEPYEYVVDIADIIEQYTWKLFSVGSSLYLTSNWIPVHAFICVSFTKSPRYDGAYELVYISENGYINNLSGVYLRALCFIDTKQFRIDKGYFDNNITGFNIGRSITFNNEENILNRLFKGLLNTIGDMTVQMKNLEDRIKELEGGSA